MPLTEAELEVQSLTKSFGGTKALDDVSVGFEKARITCLIGPNGAGKTTLFNVIGGLVSPESGDVRYRGASLLRLPPHQRARRGIGWLFQDVRVFKRMSVRDNMAVAWQDRSNETPWIAACWPLFGAGSEARNQEKSSEYLRLTGLDGLAARWAESLSFGQQKLLGIARLLHNEADCLMLDEPTAGVHPDMISHLLEVIDQLAQAGKTVVMIEHNLNVVSRIGDWVYLMDEGRIEAFGPPNEVLRDSALQRIFPSV